MARVKSAKLNRKQVQVHDGEVLSPSMRNLKPYQKGEARGRPAGKPNRITRIIKEAALLAFEQCGEPSEETFVMKDRNGEVIKGDNGKPMMGQRFNWNGADGLVGYIRHVAKHDYKAAMGLLAKILPMQVQAVKQDDEDEYESVDDVLEALRRKGYNADMVDHIATQVFAQKVEYKNRKKG